MAKNVVLNSITKNVIFMQRNISFVFITLFCLSLSSCAFLPQKASLDEELLLPEFTPRTDLAFAYLCLEHAMMTNDKDGVQKSSEILLEYDPKADPLLDVAAWYFIMGYFDDAENLLRELITRNPDDFNTRLIFAEVLIESGKKDEAVYIIEDYILTHEENINALVDLAVIHLKLNQLDKANKIFSSFTEAQKTPITRYYYAQSLNALGYIDEARRELEKAIREQKDFVEAIRELAILEEDNNRISKAIQYNNLLLQYDEYNLDIITRLIRLNMLNNNYTRAYQVAQKTHEPLNFMLGVIPLLIDEGHYTIAQKALSFIKQKNPYLEDVLFYEAALVYQSQKNVPKALEYLYKISKGNENYYRALLLIIDLELLEGMYNEALFHTLSGLEAFPDNVELFVLSIQLHIALDRRDRALEFAEKYTDKIIAENNKSDFAAEVLYNYASLLISNKRGEEAKWLFDIIFDINPDHYEAMNLLAYYYAMQNKNIKDAYKLVNKALEFTPYEAHILDTLAWIQYRMRKYKDAYVTMHEAIAIQEESGSIDPTMLEHLGFIALKLGYKDEAAKVFNEALLGKPENPDLIIKALEGLEK